MLLVRLPAALRWRRSRGISILAMGKISPSNGSAPSTGAGSLGSRGACPALVSASTCSPPEPDSLWAPASGLPSALAFSASASSSLSFSSASWRRAARGAGRGAGGGVGRRGVRARGGRGAAGGGGGGGPPGRGGARPPRPPPPPRRARGQLEHDATDGDI